MSIDGSMLAAIKHDLKQALIGGRIDKIYQPEKRLLTFTIRNHGQNQSLLISIHPQRPRVHLSWLDFENPDHPPAYCMLLRKYLIHGNIIGIKQPEFERVLYLEVERYDKQYFLILEIMGRY
ncbi:MAG: NFACT family protein, partial [Bacillota bacterium]